MNGLVFLYIVFFFFSFHCSCVCVSMCMYMDLRGLNQIKWNGMDNMDLKFDSEFKYLGHIITHFIFLFTIPSISVSSFSSFFSLLC